MSFKIVFGIRRLYIIIYSHIWIMFFLLPSYCRILIHIYIHILNAYFYKSGGVKKNQMMQFVNKKKILH